MPVPTSFADLDTVAANNSPPGTESAKGNVDNYLRAHAALIKTNYNTGVANAAAASASLPKSGGTMTGQILLAKGADIASTATVNLSTATGNTATITGTTTITGWTMTSGQRVTVHFSAATPLTYHATNSKINGGVSVTTAAGDFAEIYYDGTTKFVNLTHASGAPIVDASTTAKGGIELATSAEALALTDTTRAITPDTLGDVLDARIVNDAVGSYAFLVHATAALSVTAGTSYAGSALRYFGVTANLSSTGIAWSGTTGAAPTGTWRAMGTVTTPAAGLGAATMFVRVS